MSPTPTAAAIQARADALTFGELLAIADRAFCARDPLTEALADVAAGLDRLDLFEGEVAALRASPHARIRQAGARRLIAARLLSEGA